MFTLFIVQPIFNLLVLIYALIPGHNFGLAIILFTILVRLAMWPLVRKQLHHAKAMRDLQPEVKRIKKEAAGDRQKESRLVMEMYKERQINPFSSIGILLVQLPILLGLYYGIKRIIDHPGELVSFSYSWVADLSWMQQLADNIKQFDETLFGFLDLTRKAIEGGNIYWPAMILVAATALAQYYQSKQLLPSDKDARSLRHILRDAATGKAADQQEVSAAVGRGTVFIIPFFVFIFSLNFAAALPLYWFVSAIVAIIQQSIILKEDTTELVAIGDITPKPTKRKRSDVITTEIISSSSSATSLTKAPSRAKSATKKRKKRKR